MSCCPVAAAAPHTPQSCTPHSIVPYPKSPSTAPQYSHSTVPHVSPSRSPNPSCGVSPRVPRGHGHVCVRLPGTGSRTGTEVPASTPAAHPEGTPVSPHARSPRQSPQLPTRAQRRAAAAINSTASQPAQGPGRQPPRTATPWPACSGSRMEEKQEGVSQKIRTEGKWILPPGSQRCLAMNGAPETSARWSQHVGGHLRTRCLEAGDALWVPTAPPGPCPVPPDSMGWGGTRVSCGAVLAAARRWLDHL